MIVYRYKYRKVSRVSDEEMKELGMVMTKKEQEISIESEYEKLKDMDIDNWEQKRGPRPWEESFEQEK